MTRLLWCVAILVVVSWGPTIYSAPSCPEVINDLMPCLGFLQGQQNVSEGCCDGVKDLYNNTKSKADLVAVCICGKTALPSISFDSNRVPLLPKACGVVNLNLPPIDQNTDCNKVGDERLINATGGLI